MGILQRVGLGREFVGTKFVGDGHVHSERAPPPRVHQHLFSPAHAPRIRPAHLTTDSERKHKTRCRMSAGLFGSRADRFKQKGWSPKKGPSSLPSKHDEFSNTDIAHPSTLICRARTSFASFRSSIRFAQSSSVQLTTKVVAELPWSITLGTHPAPPPPPRHIPLLPHALSFPS
jgi:hypothetical protein